MSDFLSSAEFDKFLAELDSDAYATDMGFMDLLNPIGYDDGHVGDDGLGPAAPLDPRCYEVNPFEGVDWLPGMDHVALPMNIEEETHDALVGPQDPTSHEGSLPVNATSSLKYSCVECDYNATNGWDLKYHAKDTGHRTYQCNAAGCSERFVAEAERDAHQRRPHLEGHRRLETSHPFSCAECKELFKSKAELQQHANEAQHSPFACVCGRTFARLDVLNRHLDSLGNEMPKYPCSFCKKHRGKNGFKRGTI